MKSQSTGPEPVQINLVQTEDKGSLDVDVNRMWDLETIGIKEPEVGSMKNIETASPLMGNDIQ